MAGLGVPYFEDYAWVGHSLLAYVLLNLFLAFPKPLVDLVFGQAGADYYGPELGVFAVVQWSKAVEVAEQRLFLFLGLFVASQQVLLCHVEGLLW